jgi:hypothetical protein
MDDGSPSLSLRDFQLSRSGIEPTNELANVPKKEHRQDYLALGMNEDKEFNGRLPPKEREPAFSD